MNKANCPHVGPGSAGEVPSLGVLPKVVGYRLKDNCPLMGPGPIGGMPSVGVFLRDSSPYLCEFQRKLRTARPTSATGA